MSDSHVNTQLLFAQLLVLHLALDPARTFSSFKILQVTDDYMPLAQEDPVCIWVGISESGTKVLAQTGSSLRKPN
jgi:hypothetical protein